MTTEDATPASIMRGTRSAALDDLYSIASFYVFVWGTGFGFSSLVESALSETSHAWRFSLSGAALFATAFATFIILNKWRAAKETVESYRHVIMLIAAVFVGYMWHGYNYKNSDEYWTGKAAIWACAKLPECRGSAEHYGNLNGEITIIPRYQKSKSGS